MTQPDTQNLHILSPDDFVAFEDFTGTHPVRVDLVYADAEHRDNIFRTAIYRPGAKLWGHRKLVEITLRAAEICHADRGWMFEVKDSLRTTDAQALMRETDIVKANPHWLEEPDRLLSPPGAGGHPRGMAVDIVAIDENGAEVDMGTPFDYLTEDRSNNPAARNYTGFAREILDNRRIMERAMLDAAAEHGMALLPLPQEWWDFRFMPDYTSTFAPVGDADLPPEMRMTECAG